MARLTQAQFIEKAKCRHGDKYDYSATVYKTAHEKVEITCPAHGKFSQTADSHTNGGKGCFRCGNDNATASTRLTTEVFVERCELLYGNKYTYDDVVYVSELLKVAVKCNLHGPFLVSPNNHMRGRGCPSCKTSGYRRNLPGHIYVLVSGDIAKVGITNRTPELRRKEVSTSSGREFKTVFSIHHEDGNVPADAELAALAYLSANCRPVQQAYKGSTESYQNVDVGELGNVIAHAMVLTTTQRNTK